MSEITLRAADEDDFESMASVQRCAVDVTLREFYDNSSIDEWLKVIDTEKFRRVATSGVTSIVAISDGEIIGFASFHLSNSHLEMWYVDPAFHGKGIGRALMVESLARLKQSGTTEVTTEASAHARPRFEQLGWQVADEYDKPVFGTLMHVTEMIIRI